MFGSSGKHGGRGRGGGGGRGGGAGAKRIRSPFVPPPPNRSLGNPSAASNRLSTGGGAAARNRHDNSNPSVVPPTAPDETFSLVSHDPLSYAMIIRLTPDLVDEIKRVEAQGGTAQIKFDSNANNPAGNVIDVGGKDFRFTWSREVGDLCDIYEERRSGEDGNGLLVESGCPWRKLNVQRILDESTKNHVKMRSEEAELRRVSRKTVVLDHGSPSIKNQMKTSGPAVDFNPRRTNLKPKKEPPVKKRKVEPAQASIGSSLNYISGLSSAPPAKGRVPVPSPPQQPLASTSPRGSGNFAKALASIEVPQVSNKEITANSGKETPSRKVNAVRREISGTKKSAGATPKDLQSMLITLLLENPKGMSIKALEKAIGETVPNCTKKIEPIIKKIATYQAPGRYFLKPGVELENFKRPSPGSGSSPELAHDHTPLQESNLFDKQTAEEFEPQTQLSSRPEESNIIENIDIQQNSPDLIGDKKASDNSEGHASSSESGSDSDSESDSSDSGSESGSQSRSRSKSRSPAGSGSSSDSESDGSSSSKEGSDVDVDIMDDDKEEPEQKLQTDELRLSTPMPWRTPDDGPVQNGITVNKSEGRQSDAANGAADLHDDDEEIDVVDVTDTVPYESNTRSFQDPISFPADLNQTQDSQQMPFVRNVDAGQIMKDSPEQLDISNRVSKAKPKRGADQYQFDEKSESAKRLKAGGMTQPPISGRSKETFYSENPQHLSLDRPDQDPNMDHNVHITNKVGKDGNADTSSQKGYGVAMPGKSVSDAQRPGHRSGDLGTRGKATDMERPIRYADNLARGSEHSERSPKVDKLDGSTSRTMHAHDKFSMSRDKHKEPHDEEGYAYDKSVGKNVREGDTGDKQSVLPNSHFRRHGEQVGKLNDVRQMGDSHMGSFPKDNSKTVPEKSLRREVSDLELGEFREAIPAEETRGVKKQFDRNNSFKSKNKSSAPDNNSDSVLTKGRIAGKTNQESRKQSPPNSRVGFSSNEESLFRKRTPEDDNEDSWMRPQQKASQSQAHQMPRVDRTDSEVGSQLNRSADIGIKSRKNGYGDTNKKGPVSVAQQHDAKNAGQLLVAAITRETKPRKSDAMADLNDRGKDSYWMEGNNSSRRRRESSSDEDNCSYLKYEKDEPELKGPIKDFSQYKEYVQEYREKYGSYCSLDKNLETYRNDFNKLGRDLEVAKGRDMERYYNILEQLKDNYRQCGTRHKRLKKIFIVLHEELKHLKQRINDFAMPYTRD